MKQDTSTITLPSDAGTITAPLAADIDIQGMTCASCVAHVEKAARAVPGVVDARVNLATGRACVQFDPARTDPTHIANAVTQSGYAAIPKSANEDGTAAEERRVHHRTRETQAWFYRALAGVVLWLPLEVTHWVGQLTGGHMAHMAAAQASWMGWATLVASTIAIIYVGGRFYASALAALRRGTSNMDTLISMGASVAYGYSAIYFVGGMAGVWPPPAMHDLFFMEASGLLALISLGHWLEARARQSAGSAIRELLHLAPTTALRLTEAAPAPALTPLYSPERGDTVNDANRSIAPHPGPFPRVRGRGDQNQTPVVIKEYSGIGDPPTEVPLSSLVIGDRLLVRPGDRIPIDGIVLEGQSSIDEAMITGEPIPVSRSAGDPVIGGTINQDGRLIMRVTKTGSQTALAQIVALVENAQSTKPPVQRLADQISSVFVPAVLGIALLTGIGWYAWGHHAGWSAGQTWSHVARNVCSVLIIACPCALGLAVPATVMVGTGRGARRGILIRDIDAIQKAEKIDTVVLDKTGTVTQGKPVVGQIIAAEGIESDDLLRLASSAEQFSSHPLAKAIVNHARVRGLKLADVKSFSSKAGGGVIAEIEGATVLVGSEIFVLSGSLTPVLGGEGPDWERCSLPNGPSPQPSPLRTRERESAQINQPAGSFVHVARKMTDGQIQRLGTILISDQLKSDSVAAIAELQRMGLRVVLLTGDNRAAAEYVAKQVGITDVRAEVKPADKAAVIAELIGNPRRSHVAMVGDGINDAPALARADLGIAIGGGSDIAKEAGDIVLVSGSLTGVADAIQLSRATMRKMRQNLFLAFIYNVIAIPLAALGFLSPLIAAGAMALSDVTVVGNALLLRQTKIGGKVER